MLRVLMMLAVLGNLDALATAEGGPPLEVAEPAEAAEAAEAAPDLPAPSTRLEDPNYSRLMFAPTGRPLRKGDGYFSDYELVFPGFAVGLTDNISIAGGVSTIPGLGLGEQVAYFSPRVGFQLSDDVALSAGALVAGAGEDDFDTLGIAFAVGTFGKPDASLSVGFGAARVLSGGFDETHPILMLGGQARLSNSVALVTEMWLHLDGGVPLSQQPVGVALRFFGQRLSADVGFVFVGELLEEGFPVPWVSVSYHFGPGRGSRSASRSRPMLTGGAPTP